MRTRRSAAGRSRGSSGGTSYRKGEYHDAYWVSILKEEFDALPDSAEYIDRVVPVDAADKVDALPEWFA